MIVVITSWAPTVALRMPAMPAQTAPASAASTIARTMWAGPNMPENDEPTHTETIAPTVHWPCPPMLNSPHRKAKATAIETKISVVVSSSVCCRLKAAFSRSEPLTQGKNQLSPVPLKMPL